MRRWMDSGNRHVPGSIPAVSSDAQVSPRLVWPPARERVIPSAVRSLHLLLVPLGLALVGWLAMRVRRGVAASRVAQGAPFALDVPERIDLALRELVPSPRLAAMLATEMSLLYFALLSWRRDPHVPAGTQAFSYHRRNGLAGILWALLLAAVVELVALHFLVRAWSPRAAWTLTAVSIVGALWVLGFLRAALLRPTLLVGDTLFVRTGVQWSAEIPVAAIADAHFGRPRAPAKGTPGHLRPLAIGDPNVLLRLREPLTARGPYGIRRSVSSIALSVDDPGGIEKGLAARTSAA